MEEPESKEPLARTLVAKGLELHLEGKIKEAEELYRTSLRLYTTADAHTYLGWAKSFRGDLRGAILECEEAIRVDPDFGNAYNDIGAYLVELGRTEEAIIWLKKAKDARRYETPQFPYLNLARIYMAAGRLGDALLEIQVAGILAPEDPRVDQLLERITNQLPPSPPRPSRRRIVR